MDKYIKLLKQENLTNQYDQIEYCGNYEYSLDGYYFVLDKNEFDDLAVAFGATNDFEKEDLRNKIVSKQFKDLFLEEVDATHDSLTGYFIDLYGSVDHLLAHYGYLELSDNPDSFFTDVSIEETDENTFVFHNDTIEVEDEVEPEDVELDEVVEEKAEPIAEPPKPQEILVLQEMIRIAIERLGLDFEEIRAKAEGNVTFDLNPVISEEEVHEVLDVFVNKGIYSEMEKNFFISSYESGNKQEVSKLLVSKCKELMD